MERILDEDSEGGKDYMDEDEAPSSSEIIAERL